MPRATRALQALKKGQIDSARLELLRITCETVSSPPNSGYDDLLTDGNCVYDERTGEEVTDAEIIKWVMSQEPDEPCLGDLVDFAYARRFD